MNEKINLNDFLRPEIKKLAVDLEIYLHSLEKEGILEKMKHLPSKYLSKLLAEKYDELDYSLRTKDRRLNTDILSLIVIALFLRKEENL